MKKKTIMNDPYDQTKSLTSGHTHASAPLDEAGSEFVQNTATDFRQVAAASTKPCNHSGPCSCQSDVNTPVAASHEAIVENLIEESIVRAVFPNDFKRREFIARVGKGAAAAIIASVIPLGNMKSWASEPVKTSDIEKKDLTIGFIPITCATPIIMAEPMGFYAKHGLNAKVRRASGWAMVRDWGINKEVDAAHMLSPMPLAISMGVGSPEVPYLMPAIENVNGQAITLANKHKGVKGPQDMKGFRFCVPFEYSMHNYLLRYYLAEGGIDPDKDVQIRVVPPPEMVANLKAGNVDGYLAPDPFNQRAVYEKCGFLFKLTKEIWPGHPCCAFAISQEFASTNPNTYKALFKSIVDATYYSSDPANRKAIATAIAPKNYLNQPVTVIEQVLTGNYLDGLGNIKSEPDRIDFDPMPWQSMAKWILSQMVRWGQVGPEIDFDAVAKKVYLEADCADMITELGYKRKKVSYDDFSVMGKPFTPNDPLGYAKSFSISRV
jgi:nitrate/nitrite transport system substrate-binding protein